jgi:RHH-type proline utilization regulon transcriptional repressor/proline dehydrogenase/delta 1-pyrroline-5-carboxylate dehydrogenase
MLHRMDAASPTPSPFALGAQPLPPLRAAIDAAYRRPEPDCIAALLPAAQLNPAQAATARATAKTLVETLRRTKKSGGVEGLIQEYALSSAEGVALMCLAEALLRIPDNATRDALIRDKLAGGDWQSHLGKNPSLFVNAATWGLAAAGRLVQTPSQASLGAALTRLIAKGGEPLIRRGVDMAMRLMGEQFVTGETITQALTRAGRMEAAGFRYSYDMLGEAAMTAQDAARYFADYENAIHAIGKAATGNTVPERPGISVKLSALHPRYTRTQRDRIMAELLPSLTSLVALAKHYNIGLNIDAEEADRLDLSLDLLERLCENPQFAGWNGIGFVVQAYQKRAPFVLDWAIDLARRTGHRLMLRLVKGAYWDSEIKRAQADGLADFPVFTRKIHTDVSYLACARKLLAAPGAVFPQFATHNAQTLASIMALAGPYQPGLYEFQCLHGMGEPLYAQIAGPGKFGIPCRIYAPVGTHETLLAYLVRRLLENGANSSFVNRIADPTVPVDSLIEDPADLAAAIVPLGAPHDKIPASKNLFAPRKNSPGFDFSSESALAGLARALDATPPQPSAAISAPIAIRNPANHQDVVGYTHHATPDEITAAITNAIASNWPEIPPPERAARLRHAADLLELNTPALYALLVREAGKTLPNAVGELREAADFLRYYADESKTLPPDATPLGPIACISPWNFPLAIFTGQIAAALATGNTVLAKPAEETPLIAALAVKILHQAGIPADALHLLPGDAATGATLVADPRIAGVVFTGSGAAARAIQRSLANRLSPSHHPVPLIAETGGLNAMIVDSSALTEQAVADILASAFDSAGQRCSALRILCLQEDIATRTLAMLQASMQELCTGDPARLETDIGPVISEQACEKIIAHITEMHARGHKVTSLSLPPETQSENFVPPTIIEITRIEDAGEEIFGPVLHVLRYNRAGLDDLLAQINATGYGLTFGLHTRLDDMVAHVTSRIHAGNIYINRNIIGAVVGAQPFGGTGLSGTGPKAGGPLYLRRLIRAAPQPIAAVELPGPAGERNLYTLRPRGRIAPIASSPEAQAAQLGIIAATGNTPAGDDWLTDPSLAAVLFDGPPDALIALQRQLAERPGRIIQIQTPENGAYRAEFLLEEITTSTNTAAAGGNASLLAIS